MQARVENEKARIMAGAVLCMDPRWVHGGTVYESTMDPCKDGGALCAGYAQAVLVFGVVLPSMECAVLVFVVYTKVTPRKVGKYTH